MSFSENWIWREVPAVLLISPKPEPRRVLAGRPMLTMLKRLKNSERNWRSSARRRSCGGRRACLDQREVEVVVGRAAEGVAAERAEASVVRAGAPGQIDGDGEDTRRCSAPRPK